MKTHWKDIQSKGFLLIPKFLTNEEIRSLCSGFDSNSLSNEGNYVGKKVSKSSIVSLLPKLIQATQTICSRTDLKVDVLERAVYFSTQFASFDWHQDYESFWYLQDHYNYLNFYIPIRKPDPQKSNLSLIPMDRLAQESPKVLKRIKGQGANHLRYISGKWVLFDDSKGSRTALLVDVDKIAITPNLEVGDLLLFRGDVFHKTQDTDTDRIAVSFRMTHSAGLISRARLAQMSRAKFRFMYKNRARWQIVFSSFEGKKKEEMMIRELLTLLRRAAPDENFKSVSPLRFAQTIAKHWVASQWSRLGSLFR